MKITFSVMALVVVMLCGGCRAQIFSAGAGSYTVDLSIFDDTQDQGPTFTPRVTPDAPFPYPTSDWWTSLLADQGTNPYSQNLFAIPLAFKCDAQGLLIDRPGLVINRDAILTPFQPDLRIGVADTTHESALAAGWGDFTVDIRFPADDASWTATIGHGLPFVYATFTGGTPQITFQAFPEVVRETSDGILFRINDVHYGVYFVGGSAEMRIAQTWHLPGCTYVAIATLPDTDSAAWFERMRPAAFQRVTDSRVDYTYDVEAAEISTTYRVETEPVKGDPAPSYLALFPHHYKHQDIELTDGAYDSIRGRLKLANTDAFTTALPFHGLVPYLPEPTNAAYDQAHQHALLEAFSLKGELFPGMKPEYAGAFASMPDFAKSDETYFTGKQIAHAARLIPVADRAGHADVRDRLIEALREELVDWFTATPGETHHYFYYDRKCGGLIGMNSSFWTYVYTDHHFHYGQFVYAAAILAMYDAQFKDDYGPMVELIIHDYNSPDRDNPMFPHLRMMDPYEGHCWANGRGGWGEGIEDDGNDHESSSEAMHAWQAIFLWGVVSGNDRLRDHGAWGYVTELSAIREYYFDVDDEIYPNDTAFKHEFISLLLGGKASYIGYFNFTEYIYGIQYIPITPSSLYLGYNADHARRQYETFLRENGGVEDRPGWYDNHWMKQAMFDPDAVLAKYDESLPIDTDGNSLANVYNWLHFFAGVGQVDVSVTAPWPCVSAFRKGDTLTVVAYNPGNTPAEVPFRLRASGELLTTLTVPPGSIATETVDVASN